MIFPCFDVVDGEAVGEEGEDMFIDSTGSLGVEHARDLRRAGRAYRLARAIDAAHHHVMGGVVARGPFGPPDKQPARPPPPPAPSRCQNRAGSPPRPSR